MPRSFERPVTRALLIALGWFCVALGAIGVVVPGLPTTVFILAAAWAFSRSSRRFHGWLYGHRLFGPIVRDWERHKVIPARAKALAVAMMTASLGLVFYLAAPSLTLPLILVVVMVPAAAYILSRPSAPPE